MEAVVKFDYEKQQEDELELKVGDVIANVTQFDEGWCEGVIRGKKGVFPDNFVELRPLKDDNIPRREGPKQRRCKVVYSYAAENSDELNLSLGEIVEVVQEEEEGWWRGMVGERVGVFPSNFVEEIDSEQQQAPPPPTTSSTSTAAASQSPAPKLALAPHPQPHPTHPHTPTTVPSEPAKVPAENRISMALGPKVLPASFNPSDVLKKNRKRAPPKDAQVEKVKVLFDYEKDNSDELTIKVGEVYDIVDKEIQEGWWKVRQGEKVGLVPDNFVEVLPTEAKPFHGAAPSLPLKPTPVDPPKQEPPPPTEEKAHVAPATAARPPPLTKKKPAEGKRAPPIPVPKSTAPAAPHTNAATSDTDGPDAFGIPSTDHLDVSAVKNRPKSMGRPPSKGNLLQQDQEPTPPEPSEPKLPPWKEEINKRKQKPVVSVKRPATTAPTATTRPVAPDTEKRPHLPHTKSTPSVPVKQPPPETKVAPSPAPQQDTAWKEEYQQLEKAFDSFKSEMRAQFESFKKECLKDVEILTKDLDAERKKNAALQIDVDRLKKSREFRDNL